MVSGADGKAAAAVVDHVSSASPAPANAVTAAPIAGAGAAAAAAATATAGATAGATVGATVGAVGVAANILSGATAVANKTLTGGKTGPGRPASSGTSSLSIKKTLVESGVEAHGTQQQQQQQQQQHPAAAHPPVKKWKGVRYRNWSPAFQQSSAQQKRYKKASDNELTDMLYRAAICIRTAPAVDDDRKCMFCHQTGDGISDGPARLVNFDVDR